MHRPHGSAMYIRPMKFMVVIKMRGEFDESFMALVEEDTRYAERLRSEGVLEKLYMREDLMVCWAVYAAESREKLDAILRGFPLYDRLDYEIHCLHSDS